jgi:hypothetical protein
VRCKSWPFDFRENAVGTQQLPVVWLTGWAAPTRPVENCVLCRVGTVHRDGTDYARRDKISKVGSRHVPMRKGKRTARVGAEDGKA